ncbi:hypothetical protein [Rhodoferax aquaticus]|uniref:DUF4124 domain-containing protein n=1 Tax=Rhodoferax aquaticus TaxID=2527691 RepID=A0A515EKC4_9BURK|nr:hypothetical protein [Rhodoferax aquaticus]QDL53117.1 hypothetical protein EXZ61_02435 [Rhodoferax aquaticus]
MIISKLTPLLLLLASGAIAQNQPNMQEVGNCAFIKGMPVTRAECETLRKNHEEIEAKTQRQEEFAAKAHADFEAQRAAEREKLARDQAKWAAERAEQQAKDAEREAEYKRQSAADDKAYALAEKKAAAAEELRKFKCGADYKKPSIGMTMARVRECVSTSFKEAGQTNTAQGVVTTYRAPGGYLHVIEGKVVQWGKF